MAATCVIVLLTSMAWVAALTMARVGGLSVPWFRMLMWFTVGVLFGGSLGTGWTFLFVLSAFLAFVEMATAYLFPREGRAR